MLVDCTISKDKFKNEEGNVIEFYSYKIQLGNETFSLFPRKEDKKLINYILSGNAEFEK